MNFSFDINKPTKLYNNSRIVSSKSTSNTTKDRVSVRLYSAKSCKENLVKPMTYLLS